MNLIFFALIVIGVLMSAYQQLTFVPAGPDAVTPLDGLTNAIIETAGSAVDLAIGLIGIMAFFLGLMKIVEAAGLLSVIAKVMKPVMIRLFPDVPPEHPAMGAIIMNLSANMLGLGNAATPFGIKAMEQLNTLNPVKGTATNAMVLFLAINTAGVTLLPTSVVALRAEAGSTNPAGIVATTIFATVVSAIVAICLAKTLQHFFPVKPLEASAAEGAEPSLNQEVAIQPSNAADINETEAIGQGYPIWVSVACVLGILALIPVMVIYGKAASPWIIPFMVLGMVSFGYFKKVPIYETFIQGAKEGFEIATKIIPYLVGILVAIGIFRQSGAMDVLLKPIGVITAPLGLPVEALTMGLMRSLSGSGSFGLLASLLKDPNVGPDSYTGYLVSTIYGSSETTFYILAVYFGAVQIQKIRHALLTGVLAEVTAIISAIVICSLLYG